MIFSLKVARLLSELHVVRPSQSEIHQIQSLLSDLDPAEEQELFRLAGQNSASIFLVKQLQKLKYSSPLLARSAHEIVAPVAREERRFKKVNELLSQFSQAKIEVIALKGTALGHELYQDPFYKRMNDFDFLIRVEDLDRVKTLLKSLSYEPVGALLDDEKDTSSTHHLSPWVSSDLNCVLGIHWGIISPKRDERVDANALWRDRVKLSEFPDGTYRLSTAHFLMHLMLHLPHFKTGIREVADLLNLGEFAVDHESAIAQIPVLAKEWNAWPKVYAALGWVKALRPESPLLKVYAEVEKNISLKQRSAQDEFIKNGEAVLYFRSLQLSKVEKAFAKSWLSPNAKSRLEGWWQTWSNTMAPSLQESFAILKMTGTRTFTQKIFVRLFAPMAIWHALCSDHGYLKIVVATLLNFGNAFRSVLILTLRPGQVAKTHPAEKILDELE